LEKYLPATCFFSIKIDTASFIKEFVDLLWTNIIGPPTPADNLPQYSALIDNGTYTTAGLAVAAADHSLNTTNIDLIGLSTLGIVYIPYG